MLESAVLPRIHPMHSSPSQCHFGVYQAQLSGCFKDDSHHGPWSAKCQKEFLDVRVVQKPPRFGGSYLPEHLTKNFPGWLFLNM